MPTSFGHSKMYIYAFNMQQAYIYLSFHEKLMTLKQCAAMHKEVWKNDWHFAKHYCDATMGTVASQITSLTIVYTAVYSDADQSKHQSSASLAFVGGIHRDRWIPRTNGQ